MVRLIYNIGFHIFFVLSAPFYFLKMWRRGNWQTGFGERFARYDSKLKQAITNRDVIWLHAVSVGEVNICTQLIKALAARAPNLKVVVSTTTTTGMAELQKKLPIHISKIYYPVDARRFVRRALRMISPEAIVLVEAEIWPNFLWRAADLGTPVFGERAALGKIAPWLQTRGIFVSRNISIVRRDRLPERCRRETPRRDWLPSRAHSRRGKSQIRCRNRI